MDSISESSTRSDTSMEKKRTFLRLIIHAYICPQSGTQTTDKNYNQTTTQNSCTISQCGLMRIILEHMKNCKILKDCHFQGCSESRRLMSHYNYCATLDCPLCDSLQNRSVKEWQQNWNEKNRNSVIDTIASALSKIYETNIQSLSSHQIDDIKKRAKEIEGVAFARAATYKNYDERLRAQIYVIKKHHTEKQTIKNPRNLTEQLDESSEAQGSSSSIASQSNDKCNFNPTTTTMTAMSNHTENNYIGSNDTDPNTNDNNNSNNIPGTNTSNEESTLMETEEFESDDAANVHMTETNEQLHTPTEIHIDDRNYSSTTNRAHENEIANMEPDRPSQINASSTLLPKHPAVFSPDDIREKMIPIFRHLSDHEEGFWFKQPVTEAIAPGYFDIIKYPMDFSTIFKKFDDNQYTTPLQFCDDMWLILNNAWLYNRKNDDVYKAANILAEIFMKSVNPIMEKYGYCCAGQRGLSPSAMNCYGREYGSCTIPRDGDYFVYNNPNSPTSNLSSDEYTFCKKCFQSDKQKHVLVRDNSIQPFVEIQKKEFTRAKNNHPQPEPMIDCDVCSRRFHYICVLYHEHNRPEGYVCKLCVQKYEIKRNDKRYSARDLKTTNLTNALEKRVNTFLRKECGDDVGRVTIRVLAASDQVCKIKPKFKEYCGSQVPNGYPYRTKAIFAFQEIEGVDVVLFGMHVQEYDSRCPGPNAKRVYISYLDSVHFFVPTRIRTAFYHEILIGYLEYVKQLGFAYAHIWACPPSEGDDYIFHCHPPEQRVPKPKRLQEWYKTMLDTAMLQRVVVDYKDAVEYFKENNINKVTDIPYFEGDFWTTILEDSVEEITTTKTSDNINNANSIEPEESIENSRKRTQGNNTAEIKKNSKVALGQRGNRGKTTTAKCPLFSKFNSVMQNNKLPFFVVRLCKKTPNSTIITDPDPLIPCNLMESRDEFLNFACNEYCEFSSLRRAQYSTQMLLMECLNKTPLVLPPSSITTTTPAPPTTIAITTSSPPPPPSPTTTTITTNSNTPANIQEALDAIRHAVQCQNATCMSKNCLNFKRLIQHTKECTTNPRKNCSICNKFLPSIWLHAKSCTVQKCPLPYCYNFKIKCEQQRVANTQAERRPAQTELNSSILASNNSEPITTTNYHLSIEPTPISSSTGSRLIDKK